MKSINYSKLKTSIENSKHICIIPHSNPDGDAMGSTLALYQLLQRKDKSVDLISPNSYPHFLNWLPAINQTIVFDKNQQKAIESLQKADLIFTLDFNAFHRAGAQMQEILQDLSATFVMIDHHQMPDDYATFCISDTSYGSTCELLYETISNLDYKNLINKDIATCIYTGIVTDSGSFRFPKTTSNTHHVVSELIDFGIENSKIHENLFNDGTISHLQILGRALDQLKIFPSEKTVYTYLSQEDLDELNYEKGDTEGIVNYGLSIKGIEFSVIFIEKKSENITKISFRSQGDFDVNQFAREYFNGGGHINAAGGRSELPLQETIEKFEKIIQKIHP